MHHSVIESRGNPVYRHVSRLLQGGAAAARAQRRGQASLVIEGIHLCQMWLHHIGQPEHALFDAQVLRERPEIAALYEQIASAQRVLLAPALAASLSQVAHGPGVYFLGRAPQPDLPKRITRSAICLDRVQDPGNVGTLLRTAAAAGLTDVYVSRGSASAWSGKALRAGQGAQFALTIHEDVALQSLCQTTDLPLVATALSDAQSLYATQLPKQCLWVFGNEGQGTDPALLGLASLRVRIPHNAAVESLNVAAAAAVCLFEWRRQAIK